MSALCEAYLRRKGIESYALLQDTKEGPRRRDGHFDLRIPNEQFDQEVCVFKLICRPNALVFGERFFNDIRQATMLSYDRIMTTIVVTTRPATPDLVHHGVTYGVAVIDTQGLGPFAVALANVKAGKPASYDGNSAVLMEAFRRKTDKAAVAQEQETLALSQEKLGNWPAAENHWRASIAADGGNAYTHIALADCLLAQSKYQDAERVLENASSTFRNRFHVAAASARVAEKRQDWAEAVLRWGEIIQRFPTHWLGYRGKIAALRKDGRDPEADDFFCRYAPEFPKDGNALFDAAVVAERKKDWAAAEAACRSCIAANPPVPWTHIRLARSLREQGQGDEALAVLQDALLVFPDRIEFSRELEQLKKVRDGRI